MADLKPTVICHEAAEALRVPGDRGPSTHIEYLSVGPQSSVHAFTSGEGQASFYRGSRRARCTTCDSEAPKSAYGLEK